MYNIIFPNSISTLATLETAASLGPHPSREREQTVGRGRWGGMYERGSRNAAAPIFLNGVGKTNVPRLKLAEMSASNAPELRVTMWNVSLDKNLSSLTSTRSPAVSNWLDCERIHGHMIMRFVD